MNRDAGERRHVDVDARDLSELLGFDVETRLIAEGTKSTHADRLARWTHAVATMTGRANDRRESIAAGLAIRLGLLDEAHELVQDAETRDGMLWHAVIHRLDGDLENARYWYRRVGRDHPDAQRLAETARSLAAGQAIASLAQPSWSNDRWIDRHRERLAPADAQALTLLAIAEWEAHFRRVTAA